MLKCYAIAAINDGIIEMNRQTSIDDISASQHESQIHSKYAEIKSADKIKNLDCLYTKAFCLNVRFFFVLFV